MGGKEKNKHSNKRQRAGRGPIGKTVVFGALERGGEFYAKKIDSLKDAKFHVLEHVEFGSNVFTDEFTGYRGLRRYYSHHTTNHSAGEYVKHYFNHINGIEGAWSLIKRQIYGIHHWVSPKHLDRYLNEMTWRYNRRDLDDGPRVNDLLNSVDGRLTYKALIA